MLFKDGTPLSAADPVAPADARLARAQRPQPPGLPTAIHTHSLPDLLTDLGTLCRNAVRLATSPHTSTRLTTPTELQAAAYALIDIKPT